MDHKVVTPIRNLAVILLVVLTFVVEGCQVKRAAAPESTRQLEVAEVKRIVDRPAFSPAAWSPDGRRLAFSAEHGLWVVGTDGRGREIAPAQVATVVSWSPRLDLLAVIDSGAVWTVRDDGSHRTRINLPGFAVQLAWAPGSDRLAVVVRQAVEGKTRFELWLVSRDGGFKRLVTRAPVGRAIRDLQWFPDSLYMLYGLSSQADQVIAEVWKVRISYPDRRKIPIGAPALALRLAPSGQAIAYLAGREIADGKGQVVVTRLDGRGRFAVTPAAGRYAGLAWSPQGDKLAYADIKDEAHANIWIADADNSGRLQVFAYEMELSDPNISLSAGWAPDGRHLVFGTNTGSFTGPVWLATLKRR